MISEDSPLGKRSEGQALRTCATKELRRNLLAQATALL